MSFFVYSVSYKWEQNKSGHVHSFMSYIARYTMYSIVSHISVLLFIHEKLNIIHEKLNFIYGIDEKLNIIYEKLNFIHGFSRKSYPL
jgi:hypothetical protein